MQYGKPLGLIACLSLLVSVCALAQKPAGGRYVLLAWNDLGLHQMDGKDYSVLSISPPYNVLHAQLIDRKTGHLASAGLTLTYAAARDPSGSINTGSATKTNFWKYVAPLYGWAATPDYGLNRSDPSKSSPAPSTIPTRLSYNEARGWFEAEGLPLTPFDDAGDRNNYPMISVAARDDARNQLAVTQTVLPVADEFGCKHCHTAFSNSLAAKPPIHGWANDPDGDRDWKRNVLRLHDDLDLDNPVYAAAMERLEAPKGLAARAESGSPIRCDSCHGSTFMKSVPMTVTLKDGTSSTISSLTAAIHGRHANAIDPKTGEALNSVRNREACLVCHSRSSDHTPWQRGAMSGVSCQGCHGEISAMAAPNRVGWMQEPNCQSCHHDGERELTAVVDSTTGELRQVSDKRFATAADMPTGFSLYRYSTGHGGIQCEGCHGPAHAEYSSSAKPWTGPEDNGNVQPLNLQGHAGTIRECNTCHERVPLTAYRGPHGLHSLGQSWVRGHGDAALNNGAADCRYCHDARDSVGKYANEFRGTKLSILRATKTFTVGAVKIAFPAGTVIGCYNCHPGPAGTD